VCAITSLAKYVQNQENLVISCCVWLLSRVQYLVNWAIVDNYRNLVWRDALQTLNGHWIVMLGV
jgi:hypothetical protein